MEYRATVVFPVFPNVQPNDVVLACGSAAVFIMQEHGLVHKNRTTHSLREKPVTYKGAHYVISYDARITEKEYQYLPEIQWDLQLIARLHLTGSTAPPKGRYILVESLHELISDIEAMYDLAGKPVEVSCDLETKGLDPYNPDAWILACSFSVGAGKSTVLYFKKGEQPLKPPIYDPHSYWCQLWEQVNWILTNDRVSIRGANFKYDSSWLVHKWGVYCTNHKFDTMLVGSLLNENRSNSLKLCAKIMTSMGGYEGQGGVPFRTRAH